jgi:hypothetical protein
LHLLSKCTSVQNFEEDVWDWKKRKKQLPEKGATFFVRSFIVSALPQWPKTNYSVAKVKREDL